MAKRFYGRSILRPEKTKEEEEWEKEEEKRLDSKYYKPPTSVFEGINEDKAMRASRRAIMLDYSQEEREEETAKNEEDDEWVEERN